MKNEEKRDLLKQTTEELLKLMVSESKFEISYDEENSVFNVNIDSGEETGLLIGKKGETLMSLQTVLAAILKQKTGEWTRVVVNVGDYREKEEQYLKNLAENVLQRAIETKEPQNIYNLRPWQRRIVHMYLAENKDVETESLGEGIERYLVVRLKK